MHEQSIVQSLLALALENAEREKAARIVKINLVVGELSGVVDESVEFYFNFLRKDTLAAEAVLVFKRVPARLRCRKCKIEFTAENMDFRCPQCKEPQVEIIGGRELYIESLEVE
jgi:hydrogenase nickel incorporation protein HypA/HybF